jgi:HPt (histidine-containing phosphotransfer) domain-containing protein
MTDPVDLDRLRELFSDDAEALTELLHATIVETRLVFDKINQAVVRTDSATAAAAAHELKGFAGNVGASRLADLSEHVESEVLVRHWPAVASACVEVGAEVDRVIAFINNTLSSSETISH